MKMPMKIVLVAGARPNFMKIAPIWFEMSRLKSYFKPVLLDPGQHYDYEMSKVFFEDLDLPGPDYFLGVGSGTHADRTALILTGNWKEGKIPELGDGETGQEIDKRVRC
jgi:UDP-N-acetylglucosamine 2-epimerase (non-hydrolysing)